jgi:hypothetical protein
MRGNVTTIADLRVHLRGPNKEQFRGRCTDLDAEPELRAIVEFQGSPVPAIGLGTKAELSFRGGGLVANIDTEGVAIARDDEQVGRRYCFSLSGSVPRDMLLALANRRTASRVKSRSANSVRAVLLQPESGMQSAVEVHDISTDGLSVMIKPALEESLAGTMETLVGLTLPALPPTMYLRAFIRNRRLCGTVVLYGLQFDRDMAGLSGMQERIAAYMRGG